MDDFMQLLAREAVKSPIVAQEIAKAVSNDPTAFGKIVEQIDGKVLASALAAKILYYASLRTGSGLSEKARLDYIKIVNDARKLAAEEIAKQMAKDTATA